MNDADKKPSRGRTFATKELEKEVQRAKDEDFGNVEYPADVTRPKTRGDCEGGIRPCPFIGCSYNLYASVNEETGALKLNFPHLQVWEMKESCVLDVATRGGVTLEEVGDALGLTRERVRQIETRGLAKVKSAAPTAFGCVKCGAELSHIEEHWDVEDRICDKCENIAYA
jgi:hypothetical protein